MLKCNSLAAQTIAGRGLLGHTFCLLPNELEEIEVAEESLGEMGATKEPSEDVAVNIDAIVHLLHIEKSNSQINILSKPNTQTRPG